MAVMKAISEAHVPKFNQLSPEIRRCLETAEELLPEGAWKDSILLALNTAYSYSIAAVVTAGGKTAGATRG
jgi:hypothetical protein